MDPLAKPKIQREIHKYVRPDFSYYGCWSHSTWFNLEPCTLLKGWLARLRLAESAFGEDDGVQFWTKKITSGQSRMGSA